MAETEMTLPSREPPMDSVLDGYYSASQYTDKTKLNSIKSVMRSAISITKSKTGKVILKTNRFEREKLKLKVGIVKKERTFAEVDLNKDKILFKAQYGKWMNLQKCQPLGIQALRSKYKSVRRRIRDKEKVKQGPFGKIPNKTKWSTIPLDRLTTQSNNGANNAHLRQYGIGTRGHTSSSLENIDLSKKASAWDPVYWSSNVDTRLGRTPQERYPYSQPRRETASRSSSRQTRRRAALWREETFDMTRIRDVLEDQHLQQESLYCKHRLDKWKSQMLERQKTIDQDLKLTLTQREKSSLTVQSNSTSDISSIGDQREEFPTIKLKRNSPDLGKKGHMEKPEYKTKSVSFFGSGAGFGRENTTDSRKIQTRASVGGDREVYKQTTGRVIDRLPDIGTRQSSFRGKYT